MPIINKPYRVAGWRLLLSSVGVCLALEATYADTVATKSEQSFVLEEIVVTARRREESQQTVPLAVTAFSSDDLRTKQINTAEDLQFHTPSLQVRSDGVFGGAQPNISIRGQRAVTLGGEPAVITYFADAPAGSGALGRSLYDLKSIQVLKGPQGTLFGKNSTGGAVLYTPNRPGPEFGGSIEVRVGNYNLREVTPVINLPVSDSLSFRLAGQFTRREGYTTNVVTGQDLDDRHSDAERLSILLDPTEWFENYTVLSYFSSNEKGPSSELHGIKPCVTVPNPAFGFGPGQTPFDQVPIQGIADCFYGPQWDTMTATLQAGFGLPSYAQRGSPSLQQALATQQSLGIRKTQLDIDPSVRMKSKAINNTTTIQLGKAKLKNIFTYEVLNSLLNSELDGSPFSIISVTGGRQDPRRTLTDELQLSGTAFDDDLSWVTGAYYEHVKLDINDAGGMANIFTDVPFVGQVLDQAAGNDDESKALYAQSTYALTPKLKVTGGARYTWDDRRYNSVGHYISALGTTCMFYDSNGVPLSPCELASSRSFKEPTWTVALEYAATDNVFAYLTHRHGYKAGGFNVTQPDINLNSFKPEKVNDLEAGLKADAHLLGRPIRSNIALFYSKYSDIQRLLTTFDGIATSSATVNAAKAHVYGAEVEVSYLAADSLMLSLFYTNLQSKYDEFTGTNSSGAPFDASGNRFAYLPKNSGGLGVSLRLPISATAGELNVNANYFAQSEQSYSDLGDSLEPDALVAGYGLLNLSVDWHDVFLSGTDVSLFVSNVTDKEYVSLATSQLDGNGTSYYRYGEPRTYGLRLSYAFGGARSPR